MAGVSNPGEASDNPVHINIVPMVDVIFCLCVFFFCSFHFRQLEGKMESWLPKDKGVNPTPVQNIRLEEIRVFLYYRKDATDASRAVVRKVGPNLITDDNHMRQILRALKSDYATSAGRSDVPVIIEADPQVPWRDVVNVMSLARLEGLEKLEFAGAKSTL
jgi:biopolymer transport protein ExbD